MALLSRLRQTVGTLLVEAGFNLDTVRRWLGQKTLAMAIHYSETADTSKQMRGVLEKVRPTREQNANIRDD